MLLLTFWILVTFCVSFGKAIFENPHYTCSYCPDMYCCTLNKLILTKQTFKFTIVIPEGIDKIRVINSKIQKLGDGLCRRPLGFDTANHDITKLELPHIDIEEIVLNAFHGCSNLETLNLEGNQFRTIPLELFHDLKKLKVLKLSDNHLKTFDPDLIKPCSALQNLKLASNDLFTLNIRKILEYAPELKSVAFNDNQLRCAKAKEILEILEEKQVTVILQFEGTGRNRTQPTKSVEMIRCLDDVTWAAVYYIDIMGF